MQQPHTHLKAGISYILTAWFFLTLMSLLARYTSKHLPISTILLFQGLIGFITVLPWVVKHGWHTLRTEHFWMILQRAVCGIAGFCFIFLAVQKTSLVNTMLLNNAAPLWIPFVILIWRKTPINHALWPGVLAGFVGVICILRPGSGLFNIGALYALAAGILLSINMVTQRVLSYTERNHTVLFYYFLINILICLPWSLSEWVAPTSEGWIELLGIGVLTALGQWANFRAFHFGKASQLGPFVYSAVIYAILLDWAIYGQVPHWLSWLGIALVCAGGVWTIRASRATN